VFESEYKDLAGICPSLDDEIKSDCIEPSLSGNLSILWLNCGDTLATRRVAIICSSLNKLRVGVAANEVPG